MKPGPTIIRKCAACGKRLAEGTMLSGNTYGARYWTDGRMIAPMLPDALWLVKCGHCDALGWLEDLERLGELAYDHAEAADLTGVRPVMTPGMEDFLSALARGLAGHSRKKQRYLRQQAWWAGNDRRREGDADAPLSEAECRNLEALLPLLRATMQEDRLMRAEVLRELGRHEEALAALARPVREGLAPAAAFIRTLASQGIRGVREMLFT